VSDGTKRAIETEPGSRPKLAVVIMAAGKGTRLKSRRPKVLHEVGGKPLLQHVISAALHIADPGDIYAVVGHQAEMVKAAVSSTGIRFVEQTVQRGTGHAIQSAAPVIARYENILVLSGDVPLIQPEDLTILWKFHREQDAAMMLVSAVPEYPTGYGRIIHPSVDSNSDGKVSADPAEVVAIVEQKMLTPEQLSLREINLGLYAFRTDTLLAYLERLTTDNPHGELYLTDMAKVLHTAGERVIALKTSEPDRLLGANTIAELVALDAMLRMATANRLMAAGVTIFRPETCVIDADVEVAADTIIEPFVQLLGLTRIGTDCRIRSYTVIENCTLGDNVLVRQSCVLAESTIANGAQIGPFARVRPGCEIGEDVHIGNFVETKKAKLGRGVKAGHLTYLGDAEIGEETNIGAGVITCNYDGVRKHETRIGKGVFVGSDSTLVAPISVEDGAYIGAGSCITQTVPEGSLAVARAHQITKKGWATARRARDGAQK